MIKSIFARRGLRTAVVLDDFLFTLGGGERSCLSYARSLKDWGLEVEVWARAGLPDRDTLTTTFGPALADVTCREIKPEAFQDALQRRAPDVFIHHTFGCIDPNPARVGFCVQMFPSFRLDGDKARDLATYNRIICISEFARTWTLERWAAPRRRTTVLHPPVDAGDAPPAGERKRQIVHVGRFNPSMHNKNQKVLIEHFLESRRQHAALADWKLALVGQVNEDADSQAYFAECERLAREGSGAVRIERAMGIEALRALLDESFGYVHATGAFIPEPDQPERCEHFGLSVLEAMARGCIPLVYARGGILEVLAPGRSGLVYRSARELVEGFRAMALLRGTAEGRRLQRRARRAAARISHRRFHRAFGGLLLREALWPSPR